MIGGGRGGCADHGKRTAMLDLLSVIFGFVRASNIVVDVSHQYHAVFLAIPPQIVSFTTRPHRAKSGPKFCVEPGPVQGSHGSAALTAGRRPDAGSKCRKPRGENLGVSFANRLSGGLVGFRPGPPESGHCRASRLSCRCRIGPPRLGPGRWDFAL
jgi:hypothetical protein